jgi:hypothetical protein
VAESERKLSLRLPEELALRIERMAALELRSVNSQITWLLSQAVPPSMVELPADVPYTGKQES